MEKSFNGDMMILSWPKCWRCFFTSNFSSASDSGFRFGDANTKAVSADGLGAVVQEIPPRLAKTREMQALFLTETGVPVHLKRGARDVIAYRGTMGACGVGLVYFGYVMYRMAYGLK